MPNLNGINPSEVDSVATSAQDALKEIAGLLDTQDGDTYVFGGANSANLPVPDPSGILASGFYTQIATAVGNLGAAGAAATAAATLGIASSNAAGTSPFSVYTSQPASTLQAQIPTRPDGRGPEHADRPARQRQHRHRIDREFDDRLLYARSDAIPRHARLAVEHTGERHGVRRAGGRDTTSSLQGAINAMAGDTGVLGNRQAALTATQTNLADTQTALTTQRSARRRTPTWRRPYRTSRRPRRSWRRPIRSSPGRGAGCRSRNSCPLGRVMLHRLLTQHVPEWGPARKKRG